jgi:hypothetical protein
MNKTLRLLGALAALSVMASCESPTSNSDADLTPALELATAGMTVIDFETALTGQPAGGCSNVVNAPISIGGNTVTLKTYKPAAGSPLEDGAAVAVGTPNEAFEVGNDGDADGMPGDTPLSESGNPYDGDPIAPASSAPNGVDAADPEGDAGQCFYADDRQGYFTAENYYVGFANPVSSLSLDLYDYGDDKGNGNLPSKYVCKPMVNPLTGTLIYVGGYNNSYCDVGSVATLTVYSDAAGTAGNEVGSATYTVAADNFVDGQAVTLSVPNPTAQILSARLTFSIPDRGTGIDNIAFETVPAQTETAFAFGGDYATCFLDIDNDGDGEGDFSRWGWTNGPLPAGSYEFDIYAAAGQCDLSPYSLAETHVYVGNDILPQDNKGGYTVAPGQYQMVTGLSGDIYVVAHASVYGVED